MANSCHRRILQQGLTPSLHVERATESGRQPRDSGEQAESILPAIEALLAVTTLLASVGYVGWMVFSSVAEVVSRATLYDFIRCFS